MRSEKARANQFNAAFQLTFRSCPVLRQRLYCQVENFVDRLIRGKDAMRLRDFAQGAVDGRGRISGITHAPNHLWEGDQRNNSFPVGVPGLTDSRILLVPFLGKDLSLKFRLIGSCRRID